MQFLRLVDHLVYTVLAVANEGLGRSCLSRLSPCSGRRLGNTVVEPLLKREGNLRLVSAPSQGYPINALALVQQVRDKLTGSGLVPYGAATVWFSLPPADAAPTAWECQVGISVTGQPTKIPGLSIEDYRGLYALSLPHSGPIRDLAHTHRRLVEHAKSMSYPVRPYWRLALRGRRLADGNILPVSDVAVFIDR